MIMLIVGRILNHLWLDRPQEVVLFGQYLSYDNIFGEVFEDEMLTV